MPHSFLDMLELFRLDIGQISSNLLGKAFATWTHDFLSTSMACYDILLGHLQKSKFWFWKRKWPSSWRFLFPLLPVIFVFCLKFPFCYSNYPSQYWVCIHFKKFWERVIKMGNFYHGVAMCSHSNFCKFSCMFQAPLSWSLWSGYHWKDLFLLQKLSTDEVNFRQRWWR